MTDAHEYERVVAQFRRLTDEHWPWSGRCCLAVRDGVPECCYQIVDGAELTFTDRERALLIDRIPLRHQGGSIWVLDREQWTGVEIQSSMHKGHLANTLECASHPTRPVVLDGMVVGVVVIGACNGPLRFHEYKKERDMLMRLWQEAVDLTGVKPYYVTESVRSDWKVL